MSQAEGREELEDGLRQMGTVLHRDRDARSVLQLVTDLALHTLTRADGVSIALKAAAGFQTASAVPVVLRAVEVAQYDSGRGLCLETLETGLRHEAVLAERRDDWPEFVQAALEAGYESALSVPLADTGTTAAVPLGVLNVYSREHVGFDDEDRHAAAVFARSAANVLGNAQAFEAASVENDQLTKALETRGIIGEAKGIIRARRGCTSDEAFDELRRISQSTNQKVSAVAREVVDSITRPEEPGDDGDD
jgi:GAF domain-containing protein